MLDHVAIAQRRLAAAEACRARFAGRPYEPGTRDCARLAAHDLHKLGVRIPFLKGVRWSDDSEPRMPSEADVLNERLSRARGQRFGARLSGSGVLILRRLGFQCLHDAVDAVGLPRIAVARALPADIVALPTEHRLGALGIFMGNGNVLAYHEDSPNAEVFQLQEALHAWRAIGG